MRNLIAVSLVSLLTGLVAQSIAAQPGANKIKLINSESQEIGEATASEMPSGVSMINLDANPSGIAPGVHAIYIHEAGQCEPSFKSAGAHFNPGGNKHGLLDNQRDHVRDLPNIHVPENSPVRFEFLISDAALSGGKTNLADAVSHEKADDYKTEPAGDSGNRIACGAFVRAKQ
jgi:superoxide dismutase, Cu-Zn family